MSKRLSKAEFERYWDKAYENPFTLVDLPSGAKMIANLVDVFVLYDTKEGRLQAITRDREWYGCSSKIANYKEVPDNPKAWVLEPLDYCSI
jgi:hypothetical protein